MDNLVDFSKSGVTILSGFGFADMLSGDIANNICLRQECDVLEIVSCKKEYLIKRLLVNNANVNYKKWFMGHYHEDVAITDKDIILYEQIIRIH